MKVKMLLVLIAFCTSMLIGTVINIPADQPTIQDGINMAVNADTVLIQPGIYYENIIIESKDIIVASLFLTTQDTSYISQTIIDGNQNGSVVKIYYTSFSEFVGLTVTNGWATVGGGLRMYGNGSIIKDVVVKDNIASSGAGVYIPGGSPEFINVKIINNIATGNYAGGVYCSGIGSPTFINSVISWNTGSNGGGVACFNSNPLFTNVLITDNLAQKGGGILCEYDSFPIITNVTFTNNSASQGGSSLYSRADANISVYNSILWNVNASPEIECATGGNVAISYTNIRNGYTGNGNIDEDPLFIDSSNGDYHLTENSPCIDAGDPSSPLDPDETIADMGAYYYDQNRPSADFSANITSGTTPLIIFFSDLSSMGLSGNPILEWYWDFNNDGIIDSNEQNPQCTYYARENYTVSLTIFDGTYEDTEVKEDYIELLNSQPIVHNSIDDFSFDEDNTDTSIDLNIVFDDADLPYGDELSFSYSGNTNIQVGIVNGLVTLTPNSEWFGTENITFIATDDQNDSISDEVAVTINPINDPPILNIIGTFEADEDLPSQTYDFSQYCSQTWGETDVLTLTSTNSTHIDVTITDFDVVFESNTNNWNGTEDIIFYLNDNIAVIAENGKQRKLNDQNMNRDIVEQTVSVTINPVNDPPSIILPDDFSFNEDEFLIEDFATFVSEIEPDDLTLSYSGNTNVLITINDLEVTFEANDDWFGSEIITFIVDDNVTELTGEDSVVVNVLPVNDPPELISYLPEELNFTVIQDSVVIFEVNAEDIDSDLEYEWYVDNEIQTESTSEFIYQFINLGVIEIKSIASDEEYEIETIWTVEVEASSGLNDLLPTISKLHQNYPNPFNPSTTIKYNLSETSNIRIEIYNIKGQFVKTWVNQTKEAGYHSIEWYGRDSSGNPVSSGLYLYKLIIDNKSIDMKKCLLLK